jgi:hypothetical protein
VRVKNVRLLCAHVFGDAALHLGDLLAGLDQGFSKRLDFLGTSGGRQTAPGDDVAGAVQDENFPAADTGGNGDAAKHLFSFGLPRHTFPTRNNPSPSALKSNSAKMKARVKKCPRTAVADEITALIQ